MSFVHAKRKTEAVSAAFNEGFVLQKQRHVPDSNLLAWHIAKKAEPSSKDKPSTKDKSPPIEC